MAEGEGQAGKGRGVIALLLGLAVPQTAVVSPPPSSRPIATIPADPARLDAARRLVETMQIDRSLDALFAKLAPNFAQSVIGVLATNAQTKGVIDHLVVAAPGNRDRMVAILSQEFLTSIKRQYPSFKTQMTGEYAAAFTLDELTAINAFYSSGPGAKALAIMPELQARMGAAGQSLGRTAGEEAGARAFQRIEQEMLPDQKKPAV